MFRYTLAAYMLLQSLTGPSPCCCTLARFVAVATSWARTGEDKGVQSFACCQGPFASDSDEQQDESQSGDRQPRPKGPTNRCKCEKSLCNGVPTQSLEVVIEQSRSWLDDLTLNLAAPLMLEAGDFFAVVVYPGGTPPAARSGREIRVAFHSWQC